MVILIMGVAGCGKTTIGRQLAAELGWNFVEADEFHPPANVAKMGSGQPLNDDDRAPWLAALRVEIDRYLSRQESAVVTCSALKERYRKIIVPDPKQVKIVHLHGSPELLRSRISERVGHFMPATLLDSQLAALEPPADALTLDVVTSPEELVAQIRRAFGI